MRQATISLHPALFEADQQRWFLPFTLCYQVASARITPVSGPNQADHDFDIEPPYLRWCGLPDLDPQDLVTLDIRGTEVRSQGWRALLELADRLVAQLPSPDPNDQPLRADQFLKAYLDAQRHLDDGDALASLSSFCTAIEALLHRDFQKKSKLFYLIDSLSHPSMETLKAHLHIIRDARNSIHAQKAARAPTVTISTAQQARSSVERLLMCILALRTPLSMPEAVAAASDGAAPDVPSVKPSASEPSAV